MFPNLAPFRVEALLTNNRWFHQTWKAGNPHSRSWIRGTPWEKGITSTDGCKNSIVGDRLDCDEFPNAKFEAGGKFSDPQPSLRLIPESENRAEGPQVKTLGGCNLRGGDSVLVLPLYDRFKNPDYSLLAERYAETALFYLPNAPTTVVVCPPSFIPN